MRLSGYAIMRISSCIDMKVCILMGGNVARRYRLQGIWIRYAQWVGTEQWAVDFTFPAVRRRALVIGFADIRCH